MRTLLTLVLALGLSQSAIAQELEHYSHPSPDMPDPFTGLHNRNGQECCHGVHCMLVAVDDIVPMEGGEQYKAWIPYLNDWIPLDPSLEVDPAKSDRLPYGATLCFQHRWKDGMPLPPKVFCFLPGLGS